MQKFSLAIFGMALLGAGLVLGTWHAQSAHAASTHVYELRTYHCFPGKLPDLLTRFRDHTTKLFERHGMTNIGYFVPEKTPDTLTYVLRHDSQEQAMKNWDAFGKDPEWVKVKDASEANGKIVEKVDRQFMTPTDFSKLQ